MKAKLTKLTPRLGTLKHAATPSSLGDSWGKDLGGRPWRRLREQILRRDRYTCRACNRVFLPDELECDHVINRANGGSDDPGNLQTLCHDCHAIKTQAEANHKGNPLSPKPDTREATPRRTLAEAPAIPDPDSEPDPEPIQPTRGTSSTGPR